MESTIYFESKRGNGYLYDMQNSSMVNCHPIVEELMKLPSDKNMEKLAEYFGVSIDYLLGKDVEGK